MPSSNNRALPVYVRTANDDSLFGADQRVHCRTCRNKSGYMCAALKVSCNASEMPFYCDSYSARGNR